MFSTGTFCCMSIVLLVLGSHVSVSIAAKEFFSSIAGLEELLDTEAYLLAHLQSYVASMESQLEMLKSEIVEIKQEHAAAAEGIEDYLTSPVNAYLLIKRLDKDWELYEEAIANDAAGKSFLEALAFSRENMSYPTEEDATGSAVALVRLQETYQLDVSQVAAGILNGVKYGSSMSWQDCFQLGQQLFSLRDYNHTKSWLNESVERLRGEDYYNSTDTVDFMETVVQYHQHMGDFETALSLTQRVLELDPERTASHEMKQYLELVISDKTHEHEQPPAEEVTTRKLYKDTNEFKLYEKVCRGEVKQEPWQETPLRCKLYHNNVPFRFLMPFKLEEMNLDPYVMVFHDVLSDREVRRIKEISRPKMSRSLVRTEDGTSTTTTAYRTSQNTWLKYNTPFLKKMLRRLHDITGLDMKRSEELQVANYGIGGHYEPHFDFFETEVAFTPEEGNRIATCIFYMSDVEQGGATAFPFLHRAVQPKKGQLLVWYNLHRSGEKDYRTKHAACPVLKGSKWIANVWVRAGKQEFRRPCGLEPDHEVSQKYQILE